MRAKMLLLLGGLLTIAPAEPTLAKNVRLKSTSPACSLQCPQGYVVAVYSWELHPDRTVYDEQGKAQVAPDAVWRVSCALRCEQRAVNVETKVWKDSKLLCASGAEPGPYRGPWRITGQFSRVCDATSNSGCGMQCYAIPHLPTSRKGTGSKK